MYPGRYSFIARDGGRVGGRRSPGERAVADDLAVDRCPAGFRRSQLFENNKPRPLAEHHTAAIEIEGPAGFGGLNTVSGQLFLLRGVLSSCGNVLVVALSAAVIASFYRRLEGNQV